MSGYVTAVLAFVRARLRSREVRNYVIFEKWSINGPLTPVSAYRGGIFNIQQRATYSSLVLSYFGNQTFSEINIDNKSIYSATIKISFRLKGNVEY